MVRQREEKAMELHTQEVLGPGVEVRSGMRQGWKVGRGIWVKCCFCCLQKFGLCLEGNKKPTGFKDTSLRKIILTAL